MLHVALGMTSWRTQSLPWIMVLNLPVEDCDDGCCLFILSWRAYYGNAMREAFLRELHPLPPEKGQHTRECLTFRGFHRLYGAKTSDPPSPP